MAEPIFCEEFWRDRLAVAVDREQAHHALYEAPLDLWLRIAERHRRILANVLRPTDSVLDAGCGWGRLLSLLPDWWDSDYLGIDLSPDFLAIARATHPTRHFQLHDLREPLAFLPPRKVYDVGVLVSVRPMVIRHAGEETWQQIEANLRAVARKLLYLEYDEHDAGSLE